MSTLLKLLGDTPENEAKPLRDAYNAVLNELGLVDRDDPVATIIADSVIKVMRSGITDPNMIAERVIRELGPLL